MPVWLRCNHSRLGGLRAAGRERLFALANEARVLKLTHGVNDGEAPDFNNDSTLYTVLLLCTGVGPLEGIQVLQADPLPASAPAAARRAAPQVRRDQGLARGLLKARFNACPTEDFVRSAPHGKLQRIPDRSLRPCYTCDGIAPGIYWPDTFVHVCMRCDHSRLARLRTALRERLAALADDARARELTHGVNDGEAPDFDDDSTLYTVLQLCTGVGPADGFQALQADPLPACAPATARRAAPQLRRDQGIARVTTAWMQCLPVFHDWLGISRDPARFEERPQDTPGYRLALLVARHIKSVFDARRSIIFSRSLRASRPATATPLRRRPKRRRRHLKCRRPMTRPQGNNNNNIKLKKPELARFPHMRSAFLVGAIRAGQARARLTAVSAVHRHEMSRLRCTVSN